MNAIYAFSVPLMDSNTNSTNYFAIAKKSSTLKQLPSEATDFPNNDASVLQIHTFRSVQDSVVQYHISGEVVNSIISKSLLSYLIRMIHLYAIAADLLIDYYCYITVPDSKMHY
jgi:hypothetical protein